MDDAGQDYDLPECDAVFLVERLLEIGPVVAGSMGVSPIGWRDLEAWQACTTIVLPPWQARLLVELSREYAAFSILAEKEDCPAPWADRPMTEERRAAISRSLTLGFKSMLSR